MAVSVGLPWQMGLWRTDVKEIHVHIKFSPRYRFPFDHHLPSGHLRLFFTFLLSKMADDMFDGAIGIDLGTTYS
jgi:hypothetical protein